MLFKVQNEKEQFSPLTWQNCDGLIDWCLTPTLAVIVIRSIGNIC